MLPTQKRNKNVFTLIDRSTRQITRNFSNIYRLVQNLRTLCETFVDIIDRFKVHSRSTMSHNWLLSPEQFPTTVNLHAFSHLSKQNHRQKWKGNRINELNFSLIFRNIILCSQKGDRNSFVLFYQQNCLFVSFSIKLFHSACDFSLQ